MFVWRFRLSSLPQFKQKIKKEKIDKKIDLLKNSNINFSKFGWVGEAAVIINCNYQKVNRWMKKYMFEFYNEKCFKRK